MVFTIELPTSDKIAEFCKLCQKQSFSVDVKSGRYMVPGNSLLGLLDLDLQQKVAIILSCGESEEYEKFVDTLSELGYQLVRTAE